MRMMQKMGMKMDEIPGVSEVVIKTASKDIVIDEPIVTVISVQGQKTYQISGGRVSEAQAEPQGQGVALDADVQLVAQQTGKNIDESRKALIEAGGDLAKAILSLKQKSS
jgi:nascent polypeptide-associated complex subunit alpha